MPVRIFVVAAVLAAAALSGPVVIGLGRQWLEDPNAAYGGLVALAACVALRQRWRRLASTAPAGSRSGAAALGAAVALHIAATLAADLFVLRVSVLALFTAALWFVCGSAYVRACAVPIVLFLVAIPLPAALVTDLTLPLQLAASQLAAGLLGVVGADVVRDGNVLTLPYITLEVAEACSGMRSLVTLVALVAVYWGTCGASPRRVLFLAAATLPVALAGNGLRVAFTALLAARIGEDAVRGLVHEATGFATFAMMCAALVVLYLLAARCFRALLPRRAARPTLERLA